MHGEIFWRIVGGLDMAKKSMRIRMDGLFQVNPYVDSEILITNNNMIVVF